ncbi:helix-turn-helix transcriptional regulator [Mycobacteroides abscessus]|uniref:Helix-turn-helix family protein n=8 Tax=Mycobacteroides abscessus TaxID=36809 RepID=A0A829PIF8_9MYCO|nr:helix-turn-helix transcriptional regulator [Mycobacteroides abscessus]ESV57867.1 helix-turn-helix family protein [Mycobacteroides abscessus MAB_082312_2258]ESV61262.1 helix-turn-helix family protein [Mycobacteroides abscessus MAB_091912_2446]ETZ87200.1 helix-turn-helix family protein [Mycobacteroides abscessus MAB_030201_1075]ETZ94832.1 helix-turn-helix family protein [Mycobacteroides abscessus MAB_030201_1061]EUA66631.1 helix-turn-helix family protein [Mycobacteroides abscessus subsp. boll
MVRQPLTAAQLAAGKRLGRLLRAARADRPLDEVARAAGISPETLRKIETGRLPTPAFGAVVQLAATLCLDLNDVAAVWQQETKIGAAS